MPIYVPENVRQDHSTCVLNVMPFNSVLQYAADIVTIRVPLNGDQLCGRIYVAWPNDSNRCCRQHIKVSWDQGYLSGQKCSLTSILSAQSSCFNFKTMLVTYFHSAGITNLCFPWPNYGYCYSLRESKCLNGPNRSFLEHCACVKDRSWCWLQKQNKN